MRAMDVRTVDAPSALGAAFRRYELLLGEYRRLIDRLNVFPVPDGDTGTNMYLTAKSVTTALESLDLKTIDLTKLCSEISMAALLGARGNSGVILSQLIQGFTSFFSKNYRDDGDPVALVASLSGAFRCASDLANTAVLRPKAGTILTVASDIADRAEELVGGGVGVDEYFVALLSSARASLMRTPQLLEQLRLAGVVDSGGAGLVHLLEGLWYGFSDQVPTGDLDRYPWYERAQELSGPLVHDITDARGEEPIEELRYEVMYLLRSHSKATVDGMKNVWEGLGDSIVVVGQDDMWNCHIHTNDIGGAIEAGIQAGEVRQIRVTDLRDQVGEEGWVQHGEAQDSATGRPLHEPQVTSVVAVSNGEGVARIFHSLGVQEIVVGGQSMNPSTKDLLDAVDRCNSNAVILLPNNPNVMAVGDAVAKMSDKEVVVLRTASVIEGFSALLEYDPASPSTQNAHAMSESAARVRAGEVTTAVRSGSGVGVSFEEGEYIGLSLGGIVAAGPSLVEVSFALIVEMLGDQGEIVTLIEGDGASPSDTHELVEKLAVGFPEVSVEVHQGGQSLYPYLVGVE